MWSKNAILHSMLYPYHHTLVWYNHFYSSHSHINVFLFPYIAIPVCMSLTHLSYDVLYCSRLTRLPSFIVLKWGQPVCATCEKEVPTSGLLKWCTACLVVLLPWVADLNAGAGCLVAGVPGGPSASNTLPGYLQAALTPVWFLTRRMDRGARHDPLQRLGHQG